MADLNEGWTQIPDPEPGRAAPAPATPEADGGQGGGGWLRSHRKAVLAVLGSVATTVAGAAALNLLGLEGGDGPTVYVIQDAGLAAGVVPEDAGTAGGAGEPSWHVLASESGVWLQDGEFLHYDFYTVAEVTTMGYTVAAAGAFDSMFMLTEDLEAYAAGEAVDAWAMSTSTLHADTAVDLEAGDYSLVILCLGGDDGCDVSYEVQYVE